MAGSQERESYPYTVDLLQLGCFTNKSPRLPPEANTVVTPLRYEAWRSYLVNHPDSEFSNYVLSGLQAGFRIGCDTANLSLCSASRNMPSANQHSDIISAYIADELEAGRVFGPLPDDVAEKVHINRFGVIPKRSQPGKWRLIVDMSFPSGKSVNDGVSPELSSLSYTSVDEAARIVLSLGRGCELAKLDIRSAYRLVPVHKDDRWLLGMQWQGRTYIDCVLPFGLRSAPKIFTAVADALQWILESKGVQPGIHYLDDFLFFGTASSGDCGRSLQSALSTCNELGTPVVPHKVKGPVTVLDFLGILLDTEMMELRLPQDKLVSLKRMIRQWLRRKACRKRELLSLIGHLSYACKVIPPGRPFLRRLIELASQAKLLHHHLRLNIQTRCDLQWWSLFLEKWNGVSMMSLIGCSTPSVCVTSDASGSWGCGAFVGSDWFSCQWGVCWNDVHITIKELLPIILASALWGRRWSGQRVLFRCDNAAVVAIVNSGRSKNGLAMHLARALFLLGAVYKFTFRARHLPGNINKAADALSRNNVPLFLQLLPQASSSPTLIPATLHKVLIMAVPNWLSHDWRVLFSSILNMD